MSLYDRITELHGNRPWGSVLDAGTGRSSMRWLLSLPCERWTAVTGSPQMAEATRREIGQRQREQDRLIVGNWIDPELLAGERHEVVLADYLVHPEQFRSHPQTDRLSAGAAISTAMTACKASCHRAQ